MDCLQAVVIDTGSRISLTMPAVRGSLADSSLCGLVEGRIDRQHQVADTIATFNGMQGINVTASLGINRIVPGVSLALADRCFVGHIEGRINRQRQRPYRVATVDGLQAVGIDTCLAVGHVVPAIGFALTDGSFVRKRISRIDSQNQGADTVATLQRLQRVDILTGLGVSGIVPGIGLALADGCFVGHIEGRINHQRQRPYRVATMDGLQAIGIDASLAVVMSVPVIGFAFADSSFIRIRVGRIDGQNQRADTITTL